MIHRSAMHIHSFHHVAIEGLGEIAAWASRKGHTLSSTHFYRGELPPASLDGIDWLVVMGGPMNIYEHRNHPWLTTEKAFIADAIAQNKRLLGICLGSQLIADALGARVYQNPQIEIGWFPVQVHAEAASHPAFAQFPPQFTPLHWHGDTFSLPPGATLAASSAACRHQAFAKGSRIVGLQFHLEVGANHVAAFLEHEGDLGHGPFIQDKAAIQSATAAHLPAAHAALESLLDALEQA